MNLKNSFILLVSFMVFFVLVIMFYKSIGRDKNDGKDNGIVTSEVPKGFEEFNSSWFVKCQYRVFATYADSLYHFKIKAMMIGYLNEKNSTIDAKTIFIFKHSSGDSIKSRMMDFPLLSYESFKSFYDSNYKPHNDTIINLNYECVIHPEKSYNINKLQCEPFAFLDVNFNDAPALLVNRSDFSTPCQYFDVYGYNNNGVYKVEFAPFDAFKTQTNSWCLGYGTNIDYEKKEIIVPSLSPNSCSDFGIMINDHYILDENEQQFKHKRITEKYDFCE